jgi:hypothetical protein
MKDLQLFTHVLMVDTDMVLPADLITRLLADDKDIVGALTFGGGVSGIVIPSMRKIVEDSQGRPTMGVYWDYPRQELFPVDAHGAAALLVKREVISTVREARGKDHPMPWFAHGMHNNVPIGEDVAFCILAQKCGFEVWCDSRIEVAHHKSYFIGEQEYESSIANERHPYYAESQKVKV